MGRRPKYIRGVYTDAQNKLTQRYIKNNYDEIKVRVYKGQRAYYADYAAKMKTSLNRFCIDAMDYYISQIEEAQKKQNGSNSENNNTSGDNDGGENAFIEMDYPF